MGVSRKRKRLRHLRERYKNCYYCKCKLNYYPLKKGEKIPDNYATIEHLNSRLQYPNGRPNVFGKERTLVVACWKCNNERGNRENGELSKEEQWDRSGSPPLTEDTCQRCISPNPTWFAPKELWDQVVNATSDYGGDYNFLCPNCFIELADPSEKDIWEIRPTKDTK